MKVCDVAKNYFNHMSQCFLKVYLHTLPNPFHCTLESTCIGHPPASEQLESNGTATGASKDSSVQALW